jgi:hypothetical protein
MPAMQSRHARRRDRLAMAGPTIPSRMAKWIPKMIPMRTCRLQEEAEVPLQQGVYVDEAMGDWRESGDGFGRY